MNRLNETVLLITHKICFGRDIRKLFFDYALLSGGLGWVTRIISSVIFDDGFTKAITNELYIT